MKTNVGIFLVISLVGIFYISTIREGHGWGGDFSMYIHHAKNIVENKNYADVGYIYNHENPSISPKAYPPIFPLLLTPIYKLFGLNLIFMKYYIIVFFLLALIFIYIAFRDKLSREHVIALVAIIGFNPWFWEFKGKINSDIPFLLFIFITLIIYEKSCIQRENALISYVYFISLGIMVYICYGTRIPGLILLPSIFIHQIISKDRIKFGIYISLLIFTILFSIQKFILKDIESSYMDQFVGVAPEYIFFNIIYYLKSMKWFWGNNLSYNLGKAVFIFVSSIAIVGFLYQLTKGIDILIIFTILYFSLIVAWPSKQGLRFLIPIIPFYLFYFAKGFEKITSKFPLYLSRSIFILFLIIVSIMYLKTYITSDFGPLPVGISKKESIELFNFISDNTSLDSVIVFKKPRVLSLFAGRNTSTYPEHKPSDDKELWTYFFKIKAEYLINSEYDDPEYFRLFLLENSEKLDKIFYNNDFTVYKINRKAVNDIWQ